MSGFGLKKILLTAAAVALALNLSSCVLIREGASNFNAPSNGSTNEIGKSNAGVSAGGNLITEEEAKQTALAHAKVTEKDVTGLRIRLEYDNGRQEYEVDFYANGLEYDYDIDAVTGQVLSYDADVDDDFRPGNSASGTEKDKPANETAITEDQARDMALAKVPGAGPADVRIHVDFEDGRQIYEGSIVYDRREYDFEIDAATGQILEWEEESVFD